LIFHRRDIVICVEVHLMGSLRAFWKYSCKTKRLLLRAVAGDKTFAIDPSSIPATRGAANGVHQNPRRKSGEAVNLVGIGKVWRYSLPEILGPAPVFTAVQTLFRITPPNSLMNTRFVVRFPQLTLAHFSGSPRHTSDDSLKRRHPQSSLADLDDALRL